MAGCLVPETVNHMVHKMGISIHIPNSQSKLKIVLTSYILLSDGIITHEKSGVNHFFLDLFRILSIEFLLNDSHRISNTVIA